VFWTVVVGLAYFGAGRVGLLVSPAHGPITVWPAAGIGVGAVVLGGRRMLVGVAVGAFTMALSAGEPVGGAVLSTAAWTFEPWLALHLLERIEFRKALRTPGDIISYAGMAAVISPAVSAVVGAISLLAAGWVETTGLADAWRDWWLADMSAVVVVGSVILVLSGTSLSTLRSRASAEVLGMSAFVAVISYVLLRSSGSLAYLVLPLLFMLAFVYGQRGAAVGVAFVSTIAVVLTVRGHGPFGSGLEVGLIKTGIFICVGSVTALLVAASQDERRRAEQAVDRLAAGEAALAEAQQLARMGSFDTDVLEGRTTWSRELYRILGQDPNRVTPGAEGWLSCVHEDDQEAVRKAFRRTYEDGAATSIEHRIVRPDGEVRTMEARLRAETDSHGHVVRLVGTCQDISGRKQVEERFRLLFEDAPSPIVVFDGAGNIQLANMRALALFGYQPGEVVGRPVELLVPTPGPSASPWYRRPVADGPLMAGGDIELRGRRQDGSLFPVEVSLTPLVTEEGVLVSAAIRDVTKVLAAAETLSFQARHDSLTGLPNRMLFLERLDAGLDRARRSHHLLAVIFLDLDNFKFVNDTRGHDVGDALLTHLTPRLGSAVRQGDTVGRLGGDEFVVLCENLPDEGQAMDIAERLVAITDEPIATGGLEHAVTLSAGVVIVQDAENVTALGLLRDADAAMYAAKARGKGRVAVFDESMHARMRERLAVEASLRGAQSRGELALYYQPVVALADSRVVAVEALLRWQHPARGLLAPAEFLAVAESTGLIGEIGEWVIEEACRQGVQWRDRFPAGQALPVSVNVSAHQLTSASLPQAVERALKRTGLSPELLMLEVTEAALLADMNSARRELAQLKELGVRLIVDDFGAGYSSLPALRELMIDGLKLDRSFVESLTDGGGDGNDGSMVGAVLSMASALDAQVTAEGVETWDQVTRLRENGCDFGQGYLFARPRPPGDLTPMLLGGPGERPVDGSLVG
jgi:diguanylate cyclase (GGDEF)-like protein/PAS domain S-box-containing protein